MTSHKAVACLLLLAAVSAAFNVSDYLYPQEQNSSIAYTNFSSGNSSYAIVKVNGSYAFLLQNGDPVTNQTQMDSILYTYFVQQYSPSQSDIQNLLSTIQTFNLSRNDGYDFKNKEEYTCRDDVLLSTGKITVNGQPVVCRDNASCTQNALLLFSVYGEGLNLGSADALVGPLMDFTPVSLRMDDLLNNYTVMLNNLNQTNMGPTLDYISNTSAELKPDAIKIEHTIFRTPRLNDSADRQACNLVCYAICPSLQLDENAAQSIHDQAVALDQKIGPLSNYQGVSDQIYNSTQMRMEHLKTENRAVYYPDQFAPIAATGGAAIALGDDALSHVQNNTLSGKLDQLKSLNTTIPQDISERNFTTMDGDISTYQNLTALVSNSSTAMLAVYNDTKNAKNIENSLILVLQTKDLDPVSAKSLELLVNDSSDIDAQFRDGLTVAQLQSISANYSNLTSRAQLLLQSESDTPATRVLLLFRGFARRINTGIAEVAEKSSVSPSTIPQTPLVLGAFSALFFLSFGSIVLLIFLHIFSASRFRIPKTGHILGAAMLSIIMILLLFSVFMYLFLGKTSTDATLPEFLSEFNSKKTAAIVVDLRNASSSSTAAMEACAGSLASSFGAKNKTYSIYTLTPTSCTSTSQQGTNASYNARDCQSSINAADSSFVLGYAPSNQAPRFSVIYQNKAQINANLDYYQSCPLVALFS